jgi:hypothetical protein
VDTDAGSGTLTPPPQLENIRDNSPAPGKLPVDRFLSFFKFVKNKFQKVLFYHPRLRGNHNNLTVRCPFPAFSYLCSKFLVRGGDLIFFGIAGFASPL